MTLRLPAPAKINLHLYVTDILDNGMHALHTSFAYTEACDYLEFTASDTIEVNCSKAHLCGEKNLVFRLLQALREKHNINQGLSVFIEKNTPEQAGLGGGSSDAATALLAANRLWALNLSTAELITFATPFGADIPCFIYQRASFAQGIGEKLVEYPAPLPEQHLLLAWPGTGLSTAAVFNHFDQTIKSGLRTLTTPKAVDTIRPASGSLGENDLEGSACSLSPKVSQLLDYLRSHSDRAWMSGSGSTCVALFDNADQACLIATTLQQQALASWTHIGKIQRIHPMQHESTGT